MTARSSDTPAQSWYPKQAVVGEGVPPGAGDVVHQFERAQLWEEPHHQSVKAHTHSSALWLHTEDAGGEP